jgi:predicted nuclease of predicted toxin-antitoxin system
LVPLYLDDCLIAKQVARQLRAAGHVLYVTSELGLKGQQDQAHLEAATTLGAVLVSQNQRDFVPLHRRWQALGREHAGIIITPQVPIGIRIKRLERAARLLNPEAARNQLMELNLFETEELGQAYVISLSPLT